MPPRTKRPTAAVTAQPELTVGQPELTAGPEPAELPELMTSAEVAAALRITAYQVREYVRLGVLPAYRVGRELRIPRPAVARYLHTLRVAP